MLKEGDHLCIEYEDEKGNSQEVIKKQSMEELIGQMSDDYRVMLRKIKTIYVKKINCDLLYVKISSFYPRETVSQLKYEICKNMDKKIKSVILDLRGNVGGYVQVAKQAAACFLAESVMLDYEVVNKKMNVSNM